LLGQGSGSFAAPVAFPVGLRPVAIAVGDLDGDGSVDFTTANVGSNTVSVRLHRPDGSFAPAVEYDTAFGPSAVAIGDLNGDGRADLAVTNAVSGSVSVLLGSGGGSFVPAPGSAISGSPGSP